MSERRVFEPDAASETFEDAILAARGRIHRYEKRRRALVSGLCAAACLTAVFVTGALMAPKLRQSTDRVALSAPRQTVLPATAAQPMAAAETVSMEAGDIMAVVRYNTVVVFIPRDWIAAHVSESFEGTGGEKVLAGEQAVRMMCGLMGRKTAEALTLAANSLGMAGSRFSSARVTDMENEARELCTRSIDGDWYAVIRLEAGLGEEVDVDVALENVVLQVTTEQLTLATTDAIHGHVQGVSVINRDGKRASLRKNYGDVSLALYETDGLRIAVITEKNGAVYAEESAGLDIGGLCAEVRCYVDGDDAVYCCALSEEECAALHSGTELKLRH